MYTAVCKRSLPERNRNQGILAGSLLHGGTVPNQKLRNADGADLLGGDPVEWKIGPEQCAKTPPCRLTGGRVVSVAKALWKRIYIGGKFLSRNDLEQL